MRTSRLAAFAALALLAGQASAVHHVREYVIPFVPGTDRGAYRNTVITVTNHQGDPAPISMKAYVNRSETAQSCGDLADLAPNEIRRFHRNAGTLCVANDERADAYLRIRTVEGVHVEGFQVLAESRGNAFYPINVVSTEPAGPDGISIRTLTMQGTQDGTWRLSVGLRSSSGIWPDPLVACIHARSHEARDDGLFSQPARNCALSNEQLLGWEAPTSSTYSGNTIDINTQDGTHTSEIAHSDFFAPSNVTRLTFRACIHSFPVGDGVLPPPFLCDTVSRDLAGNAQADSDPKTPAPDATAPQPEAAREGN